MFFSRAGDIPFAMQQRCEGDGVVSISYLYSRPTEARQDQGD